jgi:methionine-rich copper-binding protein CopC
VDGVRFYKGTGNDGTHTGSLWSASGTLLATGTFTNESASGWQTLIFANPVQISAGTTYVASYYDPDGYYAADVQQFYPAVTGSIDASPLYSPPLVSIRANSDSTGNGVYNAGGPGFPTSSYQGTGYGVDVIFDTTQPAGATPAIVAQVPYPGSSSNPVNVDPTVTFNKAVVPSTLTFTLADPAGNVPGSASFDPTDTIATFTPATPLPAGTTVTVTVSGAQDQFGQVMTPVSNTFITAVAAPPAGTCPCSLWSATAAPATPDSGGTTPVELGVKFMANSNGYISGIRFYKGSGDTGTHTGTLWSATGTMLATGTFTDETTQGWQQLNFTTPVAITAGTAYVASYYNPSGDYPITTGGLNTAVTNGPLTALAGGTSGNGVYLWNQDAFPTATYNSSNYWVDVVYTPAAMIPSVTSANPVNNQTSVPTTSSVSFTFNEAVQPSSIAFALTNSSGNSVPGSVAYNSSTDTATFTPTSTLSSAMTYTGSVTAATDANGNVMAAPFSWSFVTAQATAPPGQCPCSIWPDSTLPATPDANDPNSINLGVQFTAATNGYITGIRFYKGPANTGTHVGSLWTSTGTLLGQVTFSNESAAGWQQANFAAAIPVTAGTTYVASYLAPNGEYAVQPNGMSSSVAYGPLTAPASGGVYAYSTSSAWPTSTFSSDNYFVDVVFSTTQ